MPPNPKINNEDLKKARDTLKDSLGRMPYAYEIVEELKKQNIQMDDSTIRGRFIEMGEPLSGRYVNQPKKAAEEVKAKTVDDSFRMKPEIKKFEVPAELERFIPEESLFVGYVERDVDKRLAVQYDIGKHPLTQGKQGTGKTFAHMFYAYKRRLPFFLFSCHRDFKLNKLFGDKTIENGSVVFRESLFVKAIQAASVILFDEINAIANEDSFDFHALLQNRELFVKDADNGKGRIYRLHEDCKVGFAQNPKSGKYIGGNIKPSNFLGRCTYITFPEFSKKDVKDLLKKKYGKIPKDKLTLFVEFYFACLEMIEKGNVPVDISIRQLTNMIDLWLNGLKLEWAIEDGMASIVEAVSQPKAKEAFQKLAQATWQDLSNWNCFYWRGGFHGRRNERPWGERSYR